MYVCMLYAMLFLKLWSYVQVNMWCRLNVKGKNTSNGKIRRQSLSFNNLQCKCVNLRTEKAVILETNLNIYLHICSFWNKTKRLRIR